MQITLQQNGLTCGVSPEVELLLVSRVRGAGRGGSTPFTLGDATGVVSTTALGGTGEFTAEVGVTWGGVGVVGVGAGDDGIPNLTDELTSGEDMVDMYPGLPGDALLQLKNTASLRSKFKFITNCGLEKRNNT